MTNSNSIMRLNASINAKCGFNPNYTSNVLFETTEVHVQFMQRSEKSAH